MRTARSPSSCPMGRRAALTIRGQLAPLQSNNSTHASRFHTRPVAQQAIPDSTHHRIPFHLLTYIVDLGYLVGGGSPPGARHAAGTCGEKIPTPYSRETLTGGFEPPKKGSRNASARHGTLSQNGYGTYNRQPLLQIQRVINAGKRKSPQHPKGFPGGPPPQY